MGKEMSSGREIQNAGIVILSTEDRRQKCGAQDDSMFCRQEYCGIVVLCAAACRNVVVKQRRRWEFMKGY